MKKILSLLAALFLALSPAFALADTAVTTGVDANVGGTVSAPSTNVSAGASANVTVTAAMKRAMTHADQELDRRTTNLNDLLTHVQGIKNLGDSDKGTISTSLTAQANALAALKTKIDADTDVATLKTDVQTITGSYRIYALVIPQVRIITAADRIVTIGKAMQEFSAKLEARITAAQSSGADMTVAVTALTDFNAKVTDAQVQAQAAVTAIAGLAPDQGDATKLAANTAALKDARAKVVAGQKDLIAARADADAIVKAVKGKPVTAQANTTVTASSTTSAGQ